MHIKNKRINMPVAKLVNRYFDKTIFTKGRLAGLTPIAAKILANRTIPEYAEIHDILEPTFKSVNLDVYKLQDIEKAADRISDAIINGEYIGLLCDFDVDGISSAAVLYSSLLDYFKCDPTKIKTYISHRMMYGYGFRQEILDDILSSGDIPTLLITADEGSSDEDRIKQYMEYMTKKGHKNASVIVTDHHHIRGKGPVSAYAVVNPQRKDDEFIDKTICGCTVALFTMVATRDQLIKKNYLNGEIPKLTDLLTFSTAATIADCVSMASPLNRAITKKGLSDMNNGKIAPWRIMQEHIVGKGKEVTASSIGFGLAPRINACSRTGGDGLVALKYYLSETDEEAYRYLKALEDMNTDRKKIEKKLVLSAFIQASDFYTKGYYSLVIYLPEGHHGIHGIAASRVKEKYGRPVIIFSPKEVEEIKDTKTNKVTKNVITVSGSGRSIEECDLTHILDNISKSNPEILPANTYGGHEMAAGMSLKVENINAFRELFEKEVKLLLKEEPYPKILIDGEIKDNLFISFDLLNEIKTLEPYGNRFEEPIFKARVFVNKTKELGEEGAKDTLRISFIHNGYSYDGVIFKYEQSPVYKTLDEFPNKFYNIAFSLSENVFRGNVQLSIIIQHIEETN